MSSGGKPKSSTDQRQGYHTEDDCTADAVGSVGTAGRQSYDEGQG
jgi:hypothetical protein